MCQVIEEYVAERIKQTEIIIATNLLKNGVSVDLIAKSAPTLTYEFIEELSKGILQPDSIK